MQRNSDKRGRDPRSIDMAAIIALLALVIAASAVLSEASKESDVADNNRHDRAVVSAAVFKGPEAMPAQPWCSRMPAAFAAG